MHTASGVIQTPAALGSDRLPQGNQTLVHPEYKVEQYREVKHAAKSIHIMYMKETS